MSPPRKTPELADALAESARRTLYGIRLALCDMGPGPARETLIGTIANLEAAINDYTYGTAPRGA